MLQAIIHGKKRRNLVRYWEYEDNITSCFFGPLKYFDSAVVDKILWQIFPTYSRCQQGTHSVDTTFEFWPRIGREPDLLIHTRNSGDIRCLHIEVKWFAGQNPAMGDTANRNEHQVLAQRGCVIRKYKVDREQLHSIYLVLDKEKAKNEFNGNVPDEVHIVSWIDVYGSLRKWNCQLPMVQCWRADALAYLERMINNIFFGFSKGEDKTFQSKNFDILQYHHFGGTVFFAAFHGFSFVVPTNTFSNQDVVFYKVRQK